MTRMLVEAKVDGKTVLLCSREHVNPYACWAAVANAVTERLGHCNWTVGNTHVLEVA